MSAKRDDREDRLNARRQRDHKRQALGTPTPGGDKYRPAQHRSDSDHQARLAPAPRRQYRRFLVPSARVSDYAREGEGVGRETNAGSTSSGGDLRVHSALAAATRTWARPSSSAWWKRSRVSDSSGTTAAS